MVLIRVGYDSKFAACRFVDENAATESQPAMHIDYCQGARGESCQPCAVNLRRYCRPGRARKR